MDHRIVTAVLMAAVLFLSGGPSLAAENKAVAQADAKAVRNAGGPGKGAKTKRAGPETKLVDINSAGKAELKRLPGIGDAEADRIIAGRPYLTKAHLVTHSVLPDSLYEAIKRLIIARQKPEPAAKATPK